MIKPKMIAETNWKKSRFELAVLFALTTFFAVSVLKMSIGVALATAPLMMGGALLGIMLAVQTLWMFIVGVERIGHACGMRKTPLV